MGPIGLDSGAGRLPSLLGALGESLFGAHLGCQQNSVLESRRTKVSIFLVAGNSRLFPASRAYHIPWLMASFLPLSSQ